MSLRRTVGLALATAIAACLVGAPGVPAVAAPAPLSAQTAADRAALESAVAGYEAAQAKSAEVDARVDAASAELDRAVAEGELCQQRLRQRVVAMYRAEDDGTLSLLLSASSIQELASRLDVLDRMARRDAENLRALKAARAAAAASAEELLALQAEAARALDEMAQQVAGARTQLAASEAVLREYEARAAAAAAAAAAARRAATPAKPAPDQQLTGTGDWQTGVASHYGRNFTGRGASGEQIGPYSMIVAHKTLPFGTLIEFEYNGRRAVARVADRGPFTPGRDFDLGPGVVRVLDFSGVHEVRYRIVSQ